MSGAEDLLGTVPLSADLAGQIAEALEATTAPFAVGELVRPAWQAGQQRRGTVQGCELRGRYWWVSVAWDNDPHKEGAVRSDQLARVEE